MPALSTILKYGTEFGRLGFADQAATASRPSPEEVSGIAGILDAGNATTRRELAGGGPSISAGRRGTGIQTQQFTGPSHWTEAL